MEAGNTARWPLSNPALPRNLSGVHFQGHAQRTASDSCATSARSASTVSSSSSRWSAHAAGVPGTRSPPAGDPARAPPPWTPCPTEKRVSAELSGGGTDVMGCEH